MKDICHGEQRKGERRAAKKATDRDHDERTDNRVFGMACEEEQRRRRRDGEY